MGWQYHTDAQSKPQGMCRGFDTVDVVDFGTDERREVNGFPNPLEKALQMGPGANP
ncbi:hypothetical protein GCM10023063_23680 [Arthrobacter methylotrophus]